jgi:hypothetical protein
MDIQETRLAESQQRQYLQAEAGFVRWASFRSQRDPRAGYRKLSRVLSPPRESFCSPTIARGEALSPMPMIESKSACGVLVERGMLGEGKRVSEGGCPLGSK